MTLPVSGPLAMTDIQTEFGGTNPIGLNEYYAGGGLVPAGTTGTYGAVPSSGALSIQNFYGTSNYIPIYIEDVFSTYLYAGNSSTQTINNGIALATGPGEGSSAQFNQNGADYLTKSSDLTGNTDGSAATVSFWIKTNTQNTSIIDNPNSRWKISIQNGKLWCYGKNTGDNNVINFTSSLPIATNLWVNVLFSFSLPLGTGSRYVYINDVLDTGVTWTTYNTGGTIDRAATGSWYVGSAVAGLMTNFYTDYTYRDLSVTANRRYFINSDGTATAPATMSALSPILYLPLQSGYSVGTNLGTGGNFTAVSVGPIIDPDNGPQNLITGQGGLVWIKSRGSTNNHRLVDSARGNYKTLITNSTAAEYDASPVGPAFTPTGFTVGNWSEINDTGLNYASWTFRKQPKFFDVVTYTGNMTARTISHNLGSVPGCIIVKSTNGSGSWYVYHRSVGNTGALRLNLTNTVDTSPYWNNTTPTSTSFTVGVDSGVNALYTDYVAYLFAHNAGGFGDDVSENVISCGSFIPDGSGNTTVNLGYEPQWVIWKSTTSSDLWQISDNMRGWANVSGGRTFLQAQSSSAESVGNEGFPTATGFEVRSASGGQTFIYIAIRRGLMKTPEVGTSVFAPNYGSDVTTYTTNFPLDSGWDTQLPIGGSTSGTYISARLVGSRSLVTSGSAGETTSAPPSDFWQSNTSYRWNTFGNECSTYAFRRAPSFFDVVCYTGDATLGRTVAHNLTIAPELMIVRQRTGGDWYVYSSGTGATKFLELNTTAVAVTDSSLWNNTAPTSSVFTLGDATGVNRSNTAFIAYLFATCPGVSKVFSYTGNGSSQTINCGFTGGARFILIKRTDSTGDWYVWDSARGIVAGNDPYYRLNSTSSEVTTNDSVDTTSTGFIVNQISATSVNVSSATYIGLAIA